MIEFVKKYWLALGAGIFFMLGYCFMSVYWYPFDMEVWGLWAQTVSKVGLSHAYVTEGVTDAINYNPVWVYCLRLFTWFYCEDELLKHIYLIKLGPWFLECLTLFLFIGTASHSKFLSWKSVFLVVCPFLWYNTLFWGQIDGIYTCFILIGLYFLAREQFNVALILLTLALLTKPQAIVVIPLFGIPLLFHYLKKPFHVLIHLSVIASTILLVCLPFILAGFGPRLIEMNSSVTLYYAHVSKNAFNIWEVLVGGDLYHLPDETLWHGWSYHNWGLLFFCMASFVVLWPALKYKLFWQQADFINRLNFLFLLTGLLYLSFFLFNTQMHERYLHPAVWAFAGFACTSGKWLPFLVCGLIYWINLEAILQATDLFTEENEVFFKPFCGWVLFFLWVYLVVVEYLLIKPKRTLAVQ